MKRIKFTLICTAALMLAMPLAGCMGGGDSGTAHDKNAEQQVEMQTDENEGCPDGKCPDSDCNDGKCPEKNDGGERPDGKCPLRPLPPHDRHGRIKPIPCPHN